MQQRLSGSPSVRLARTQESATDQASYRPEIPTRFSGILSTAVPYLAEVEKMGVFREPVTCFSPTSPASEVYRALWEELRATMHSSA